MIGLFLLVLVGILVLYTWAWCLRLLAGAARQRNKAVREFRIWLNKHDPPPDDEAKV